MMLKHKCRWMISMLLAAALLFSFGASASAWGSQDASQSAGESETAKASVYPGLLDFTKKGTITIQPKYEGTVVRDGSFKICQVAVAKDEDGNQFYEYTTQFRGCEGVISLESLDETELATKSDALHTYAEDYVSDSKWWTVASVDKNTGIAAFSNLGLGLYLVEQETAAEGYQAVKPFLVSIPILSDEGDHWDYEVEAVSKMQVKRENETETTTTPETSPHRHRGGGGGNSGGGGGSTEPHSGNPEIPRESGQPLYPVTPGQPLPQTGQLNWPVPCLAIGGIVLFAIGWWITFGSRKSR